MYFATSSQVYNFITNESTCYVIDGGGNINNKPHSSYFHQFFHPTKTEYEVSALPKNGNI